MPKKSELGQSLIELALMLPLLLLMLLGTIEVGRMFYLSIEVNNAARAGVAYGAQTATTAADSAGIAQAARNDAQEISGLNVTSTTYCECSAAPGTQVICGGGTCAMSRQVLFLQVDTSAQVATLTGFRGLPSRFTLSGDAIMRVPDASQ